MVPETVSHVIGGRHVHSTLRKTYGVTDPATGKEYAQVEVGLGADVNQAVLAARSALETGPWSRMAAPDRARVLPLSRTRSTQGRATSLPPRRSVPVCRSPRPRSRLRGRAGSSASPPS